MYFLDKITVGDEENPAYQSYEYSPQATLLGLPTWAALLLLVALPILSFITFFMLYGKRNNQ